MLNLEEVDHLGDYASATNLVSVEGEHIDSIDFDPNSIVDYDCEDVNNSHTFGNPILQRNIT